MTLMTDTDQTARRMLNAIIRTRLRTTLKEIFSDLQEESGASEEETLELALESFQDVSLEIEQEIVERLQTAHIDRTGRRSHRYPDSQRSASRGR